MNIPDWAGVAACLAGALCATGLMRRYALRSNLLDVPNARSSHAVPTPRGGGVAVVAVFFAALGTLGAEGEISRSVSCALFLGGGMVALIGFLDDRRPRPAGVRFAVHLAAAAGVVALMGGIPEAALGAWGIHGANWGLPLAALMIVWTTNLFNFMDGIDGIAGAEAVFVAGAGAVLNIDRGGSDGMTAIFLDLMAANLGFLYWNWPPARIFMGDVGSGFVGFCIIVLGLAASRRAGIPVEAWGILGGVFLTDSTVTLLRRFARGDRWFDAHRTHAYQHLARRWKGHLPVTLLAAAINVFWLFPWALHATRVPGSSKFCLVAALCPLAVAVWLAGAGRGDS